MTTTADGRTIELTRDDQAGSYLARIDGEVIGRAMFLAAPGTVTFTHTEIDPSLEGQGVGSALISWALDDLRSRGDLVVPTCPFVRGYIGRHQDRYADLVYREPPR